MTAKPTRASSRSKRPAPSAAPDPSLRLYRRIAFGFVALVTVVLAVVLFLSSMTVTIRITPKPETITAQWIQEIAPEPSTEGILRGVVRSQTISKAETVTPSGGDVKDVPGKAIGTVTLINESTHTQPLVATTRLLTPEGILFRLDRAVTIPAGGQTTASVTADQPGAAGDIGPSRFIIPGLPTVMQKQIYAESDAPMTGGIRRVRTITQEDLDAAAASLRERVIADVRPALEADAPIVSSLFVVSEVLKQISDTKPGEESGAFTIAMDLQVYGIWVDTAQLKRLQEAKLYERVSRGQELLLPRTWQETLAWDVETVRSDGSARTRLSQTAQAVVSPMHSDVAPERFVGKTQDEIRTQLLSSGIAADASVMFFPPWLPRAPHLLDHIDVVILRPDGS